MFFFLPFLFMIKRLILALLGALLIFAFAGCEDVADTGTTQPAGDSVDLL